MLKAITNIPIRYYQFALFNLGLVIAISKEMSLLTIISSLLLAGLALAPFAVSIGLLQADQPIIHQEISRKLRQTGKQLGEYFQFWNKQREEKKMKLVMQVLLGIYISSIILCPCLQKWFIMNGVFLYIFMHEQLEWLQSYCCKVCSCSC